MFLYHCNLESVVSNNASLNLKQVPTLGVNESVLLLPAFETKVSVVKVGGNYFVKHKLQLKSTSNHEPRTSCITKFYLFHRSFD